MDLNDLYYKDPSFVDPTDGMSLISAPMMSDPYFRRSVIFLLDREEDGTHLGLVLNRATDVTLDMLLEDWPETDKIHIYNGGPVELDRLFMLHRLGDVIDKSTELIPGIYSGGNPEQLRDYIAAGGETEGKIRFFLGYSGWGSGQLTKEIVENTWAVNPHPDTSNLLLGKGNDYWRREVASLGADYKSWLHIPEFPSMN